MISSWDHGSDQRFVDYYAEASLTAATRQRFVSIRDVVLRVFHERSTAARALEVADIGCGAGSQCMVWAELGHRLHGLDINHRLLELAKERALRAGHAIDFQLGSAAALPWPDGSMDVCLLLELLEHIGPWESCLTECARVLRPGGVLFLTTTNKLCPLQQEFNLPLYSWYPAPLKRHCERLATTTHPEWVNFAKYPAVNWFSFYSLRAFLTPLGFDCRDRFDLIEAPQNPAFKRGVLAAVRRSKMLRRLAHMLTRSTIVAAVKTKDARARSAAK
ncbi:MAG TPA: class I SAM-dependent methyltransferase [Methylomirabilota bacterium]|nr:class I SAM-dependent methyltransferase [Methylomirabilota bacterium]